MDTPLRADVAALGQSTLVSRHHLELQHLSQPPDKELKSVRHSPQLPLGFSVKVTHLSWMCVFSNSRYSSISTVFKYVELMAKQHLVLSLRHLAVP